MSAEHAQRLELSAQLHIDLCPHVISIFDQIQKNNSFFIVLFYLWNIKYLHNYAFIIGWVIFYNCYGKQIYF